MSSSAAATSSTGAFEVPRKMHVKSKHICYIDRYLFIWNTLYSFGSAWLKKKANFIQLNVEAQQKYTVENKKKNREWGDEFDL